MTTMIHKRKSSLMLEDFQLIKKLLVNADNDAVAVDEFHFTNEMEFETFLDEATSNLPLIQPLQTSEFRRGLRPQLNILVQPTEKFRFRYKSEMMGTHGSLSGDGINKRNHPQVKLENFSGQAFIRCTLVTASVEERMPHAHRLVRKEGNEDRDDPHDIEVSASNNYTATFQGMGIIHTARKNLKDELIRKKKLALAQKNGHRDISKIRLSTQDELEIAMDADAAQKSMNLNTVALCFQAFTINDFNMLEPITQPVYSTAINNLKSALTGELKICKIDRDSGTCDGNEEIFMFVEKVGKKNIRIKFFEHDSDDSEVWRDYGKFSEVDVHHQYAISFRTPPYKDKTITEPKKVWIQLERPSDGECSANIHLFTYMPSKRTLLTAKKRTLETYGKKALPNSQNGRLTLDNEADIEAMIAAYNLGNPDDGFKAVVNDAMKSTAEPNSKKPFFKDYLPLCCDGGEIVTDERFPMNMKRRLVEVLKTKPDKSDSQLRNIFMEKTMHGDTLLLSLLRNESFEDVSYILTILSRMPADHSVEIVNAQNVMEVTPLHLAVFHGKPDIVNVLLILGADVTIGDEKGLTAIDYGIEQKETFAIKKCIDLLLKNLLSKTGDKAPLSQLIISAAKHGSLHTLMSLVQAGADINTIETKSGKSALHLAIEGQYKDMIIYLVKETKIEVNKKTHSGYTPLHFAVTSDWVWRHELCKLLREHGADPTISHRDSNQSMDIMSVKDEIESDEEIESTDENDSDSRGITPLDFADDKPEMRHLLLDNGIKSENQEMDETSIMQLASILDKTKGWVKLAEKTGLHYLIALLNDSKEHSPSLRVINYAMENKYTPDKILVILRQVGERDAAAKLAELMSND